MAAQPTIYIVCSDRPRNGKTLLARVLVDFLLMEGRDPFCFDLSHPEGALRGYFPGRTAMVDFAQSEGAGKVFDMPLARPGRDYVIDVTALQLPRFCEIAGARQFSARAQDKGFRVAVMFVVDREEKSLTTAGAVEEVLVPDLFVPVANRFIGSALPDGVPGPVLTMEGIDGELHAIVANRRFSLRTFMMGDEAAVPTSQRKKLKLFLHGIISGLRDLEPALTLQALRETAP